jgi:choline transporter-like protein 2/4/5
MGRKVDENYELKTSAKSKRKDVNQTEFKLPKHGCTDIICTIIFLIFLIGLVTISVYAYVYGKPEELILPKDSMGNICGKTKNYENKKYLLFFDITRCVSSLTTLSCPTQQICVEKCPDETLYNKIPSHAEKIKNYCFNSTSCPPYVFKSNPLFGRCLPFISKDLLNKTIQVFNPETNSNVTIQNSQGDLNYNVLEKGIDYIIKLLDLEETFQLVYQDIGNSYLFILAVLGIGTLISLIWLFILRFIVKPVVYLSIIVVFGLLGFGLYFCIQEYLNLKDTNKEWKVTTDFKYYAQLKETWLGLSIIIGVVLLIFSLVMLFLRKRIVFAANVIKEVSKAVVSLPASFIWPLFPFILLILVLAYCCSIALYLASSGTQLFKIVDTSNLTATTVNEDTAIGPIDSTIFVSKVFIDNNNKIPVVDINTYSKIVSSKYLVGDYCIPEEFYKDKINDTSLKNLECYYYSFGYPTKVKGINIAFADKHISKVIEFLNQYPYIPQLYVAFMLLWLTSFVTGLNQMTLAGSFGIWYWTPFKNEKKTKKKNLPFFTLFKSFGRAFFLHFGTLAFGSLIIAIIKFIRILLDLIHTQAKSKADSSKLARFLLACCKCCFWCLERFIKFMNRYAYIITAVYGKFLIKKLFQFFCSK